MGNDMFQAILLAEDFKDSRKVIGKLNKKVINCPYCEKDDDPKIGNDMEFFYDIRRFIRVDKMLKMRNYF
jgi:hypothetical protein